MRKLMSLLIAAMCFSLAGPIIAHAGEHQSAPRAGSPEFERMKHLAGAWEGTSDNDHIVQKWIYYDKGKAAGGVTLTLARVH